MELVVGRILRAHGIKGEAVVEVRTDDPAGRFTPGTVFGTDPAPAGPLTIRSVRPHQGRLLVGFAEVADRGGVEARRGVRLLVEAHDGESTDGEDYYDQQLVGLAVATAAGVTVGTVAEVMHLPGHDLLAVRSDDSGGGTDVLIPFVREIVSEIDLAAGRLVVTPPPGLLDPAEAEVAGPDGDQGRSDDRG
jgi:16S rRNA processing protein RimM